MPHAGENGVRTLSKIHVKYKKISTAAIPHIMNLPQGWVFFASGVYVGEDSPDAAFPSDITYQGPVTEHVGAFNALYAAFDAFEKAGIIQRFTTVEE
jgi:hypothetical protein